MKKFLSLFESIAEYRYGRYGSYEKQAEMKLQNHKNILRINVKNTGKFSFNWGRKLTHDSVKGQESYNNHTKGFF